MIFPVSYLTLSANNGKDNNCYSPKLVKRFLQFQSLTVHIIFFNHLMFFFEVNRNAKFLLVMIMDGQLRRGGSLVNFLQIGEGQTCFILNRGRVTVFLARKKLPHVASILYIQAKLPVKINLNYLQVSKNLYIKKLSSPN